MVSTGPAFPPFFYAELVCYEVFTDGSTPREGGGVSGYAAVVFDARDRSAEPVSIGSWFKCSG